MFHHNIQEIQESEDADVIFIYLLIIFFGKDIHLFV